MSNTKYKNITIIAATDHTPELDPRLISAQIKQESQYDPTAKSPAGAEGLMQIMPETWDDLTKHENLADETPYNPHSNVMMGCKYMSQLYNQWTAERPKIDRICLTLASYNAGLGNILKAQKLANNASGYAEIIAKLPDVTGHHSKETIRYVKKILGYYNEFVVEGW